MEVIAILFYLENNGKYLYIFPNTASTGFMNSAEMSNK